MLRTFDTKSLSTTLQITAILKWRTSVTIKHRKQKASDIFEFSPRSDLDSQTNLCTLDRDENQQSPPKTKWHVINAENSAESHSYCSFTVDVVGGRKLN